MALLADKSGDAYSNITNNNDRDATWTMPGNVALSVETVVATVTNNSASAVRPELTIRDVSGQVIGTVKSQDSIPAGDTGTATFAVGLVDSGGGIRFDTPNTGDWLDVTTNTNNSPAVGGITLRADNGRILLQSDTGLFTGVYITSSFEFHDGQGGIVRFRDASLVDFGVDAFVVSSQQVDLQNNTGQTFALDASGEVVMKLATGQPFTVLNSGGSPIFRVDEDGDLHGLTGKALTFDL